MGQIRIIGGLWRGRKIDVPSASVRPSSDRVRETLFNWLGQDLTGLACLDLFAGSGALGFEALSRSARSVTFVERDSVAYQQLRENAKRLSATNAVIHLIDASDFLDSQTNCYDIMFVDPPFYQGQIGTWLAVLRPRLKPGGRLYLETERGTPPIEDWLLLREKKTRQVVCRLIAPLE